MARAISASFEQTAAGPPYRVRSLRDRDDIDCSRRAGIGPSLLASGSTLVATIFALAMGRFYGGDLVIVPVAFLLAGCAGLLLTVAALRSDDGPVPAAGLTS